MQNHSHPACPRRQSWSSKLTLSPSSSVSLSESTPSSSASIVSASSFRDFRVVSGISLLSLSRCPPIPGRSLSFFVGTQLHWRTFPKDHTILTVMVEISNFCDRDIARFEINRMQRLMTRRLNLIEMCGIWKSDINIVFDKINACLKFVGAYIQVITARFLRQSPSSHAVVDLQLPHFHTNLLHTVVRQWIATSRSSQGQCEDRCEFECTCQRSHLLVPLLLAQERQMLSPVTFAVRIFASSWTNTGPSGRQQALYWTRPHKAQVSPTSYRTRTSPIWNIEMVRTALQPVPLPHVDQKSAYQWPRAWKKSKLNPNAHSVLLFWPNCCSRW